MHESMCTDKFKLLVPVILPQEAQEIVLISLQFVLQHNVSPNSRVANTPETPGMQSNSWKILLENAKTLGKLLAGFTLISVS